MKPRVTFAHAFPLCFDTRKQFEEWQTVARMAPPTAGLSVCADCKPSFQASMLKARRCENPHIQFDKTGEPILPTEPLKDPQ